MAEVDFRLNVRGLREMLKSEGMRAALLSEAKELADIACAEACGHAEELGVEKIETPPYYGHAEVLDYTAVGAVSTRTYLGILDNNQFKTLGKRNH